MELLRSDYIMKYPPKSLKPLKFHHVHSTSVIVSPNQLIMRKLSPGWGVTFSSRPIDVDEVICLRIVMFHKGSFRFGLTTQNPADLDPQCLDNFLSNTQEKTIIKELSASSTVKDTMIFIKLNPAGQVVYGWMRKDKSKDKGVLFGGIELHLPVWAVFELSGKNLAIKYEESVCLLRTKSFRKSGRLKKAKSMEFSTKQIDSERTFVCDAETSQKFLTTSYKLRKTRSYSKMPRPNSINLSSPVYVPLEVSSTATPDPILNVENTHNLFNIPLSNIEITPASTQSSTSNSENKPKKSLQRLITKEECRTTMSFHCSVGKNINLSTDRLTVTRVSGNCNGYVFTRRPIELNEKVKIKLVQVNSELGGSLGFGLTVCDPSDVLDFPDDADHLLDRQEYWVVIKNLYRNPMPNDELEFLLTNNGEVIMFKNNSIMKTIVHVDPTLSLWIFFDLCGSIQKISCLGSIIYKETPKILININKKTNKLSKTKPISNDTTCHLVDNISSPIQRTPSSPNMLNQTENITSEAFSASLNSPKSESILGQISKRSKSLNTETASIHQKQIMDSPLIGRMDIYNDIPGSLAPPLIPVPQNSNICKTNTTAKRLSKPSNHNKPQTTLTPLTEIKELNNGNSKSTTMNTEDVEKLMHEISLMGQKNKTRTQEDLNSGSECTVCMENTADCVLYTCGHICMCHQCGQNILKSQKPFCPICRKSITDIIRIYKS